MPKQYPKDVRERAVRLLLRHRDQYETEFEAIRSIAVKLRISEPGTPMCPPQSYPGSTARLGGGRREP